MVCNGTLTVTNSERFGVINEPGTRMDMLLGAGLATNGVNCALLAVSGATADLVTMVSAEEENWETSASRLPTPLRKPVVRYQGMG